MKFSIVALLVVCGLIDTTSSTPQTEPEGKPQKVPISSRIIVTKVGERTLVQDIWIDAPIAKVWAAFTTDKGWMSWASPLAKIELKAGGTILSHYKPKAKIGDPGTNTLHILNYVPERILTLQADLHKNWPEVMKEDHKNLMNILVFDPVSPKRTHLVSYGVGYGSSPVYEKLLKFFIPANEGLYRKLKAVLEGKDKSGVHDK